MAEEEKIKFFKERTVLVLGAGASKDYGFPLGAELKRKIRENTSSLINNRALEGAGYEPTEILEFSNAFHYSEHSTIDQFLDHKTSLRKLGSYLIAGALSPLEQDKNLLKKGGWYKDLYQFLCFSEAEPIVSNLSVVTLNYDRSFEHYMTKTIDFNVPVPIPLSDC
ncbi:MAG: hypothetical protein PF904_20580 [Kiritimatiellae bacterium]|jgi:hypothetical protein|nr:hypothetical protein [Kiritimatiellia bacterium]